MTTVAQRERRNMNATAPARVAMCIWGQRYSEQRGGAMEFWDTLSEAEKRQCIAAAENIKAAPMTE